MHAYACRAVDGRAVSVGAGQRVESRPCADRPAALRLQYACSGPRVMARSWSSWPRCHGVLGGMGRPHRQQVARPAATMGARARRSRSWSRPYPRWALVPRARSCARVCSGHRVVPAGTGRGQSRHGCLARAMVPTSVRVVDGPHGCVAVGAVIPCAHRGGACGRDVWVVDALGVEPRRPRWGRLSASASRTAGPHRTARFSCTGAAASALRGRPLTSRTPES